MRILKLAILAHYILWGGMALYSIGDLLLKNVWFEIFTIGQTPVIKIYSFERQNKNIELQYTFMVGAKTYEGNRGVYKPIADERLPSNLKQVEISYNTLVPYVNWIDDLGMKDRMSYVGLTMSGIFLTFVILVDLFADKKKWIDRYQKAFGG